MRTGRKLGDVKEPGAQVLLDQMEVLSGLRPGELVVLPAGAVPQPSGPSCPIATPEASSVQEAKHE